MNCNGRKVLFNQQLWQCHTSLDGLHKNDHLKSQKCLHLSNWTNELQQITTSSQVPKNAAQYSSSLQEGHCVNSRPQGNQTLGLHALLVLCPPLTSASSAAQCRFWPHVGCYVLLRGVSFWSLVPVWLLCSEGPFRLWVHQHGIISPLSCVPC